MGFLQNLVLGAKFGKKAAQAKDIIVSEVGVSPDENELKQMCVGHGFGAMADHLNPHELACYYVGNYWKFGSGPAQIQSVEKARKTIDKFYRTGLATVDLAREDFDKKYPVRS